MIYYENIKRQLTQQELDGNFEQLLLKARKRGADMSLTLRKDLTRPLTAREMDSDFQSLDLAVKRALYGDGPYPSADFIFDGATVLPAGLTFSRPSKAWGWRNGVLVEYDVDEPVFEDGGLRLEPKRTNSLPWSSALDQYAGFNTDGYTSASYNPTIPNPYNFGGVGAWEFTVEDAGHNLIRILRLSSLGSSALEGAYYYVGWFVKANGQRGQVQIGRNRDMPVDTYAGLLPELVVLEQDTSEGAPLVFELRLRAVTSNAPSDSRVDVGDRLYLSHIQYEEDPSLTATSPIITAGERATRAADNASIQGAAFSSIFNPNQGALILPHSSFGEGNIITLGGLQVARTEDGLELNNTAIPDTEDAKQNLKLRWGGNGLDVFVGNTKALHDIPLPANWGDADSLVLADNDSAGKYIDRLAVLTEAPTDEQMEGM